MPADLSLIRETIRQNLVATGIAPIQIAIDR